MECFINLTNHPSGQWSDEQRAAALAYGPIVDLPFPAVSETADLAGVCALAARYFHRIREYGRPVVLIQGESVFVYRLVRLLEQARIPALACVSRRRVREARLSDGSTQKIVNYVFGGFRPYWEDSA